MTRIVTTAAPGAAEATPAIAASRFRQAWCGAAKYGWPNRVRRAM